MVFATSDGAGKEVLKKGPTAPTPLEAIKSESTKFKETFKDYSGLNVAKIDTLKTEDLARMRTDLKVLNPEVTAADAFKVIRAEANKGKELPAIAPAAETAKTEITDEKNKLNHLMQYTEYKAQVMVLDLEKAKYYLGLDEKFKNYRPEQGAELLALRKKMESLHGRYVKLEVPATLTSNDVYDLHVGESIKGLAASIADFGQAANEYHTSEAERVDKLAGIKVVKEEFESDITPGKKPRQMTFVHEETELKADSVQLPEGFAEQDQEGKTQSGNLYFDRLNTLLTKLLSAQAECKQLLANVKADVLLGKEEKLTLLHDMKISHDRVVNEIGNVHKKIQQMGKDGIPVSEDHLKAKREEEKKILDAALAESHRLQQKYYRALVAVDPRIDELKDGPKKTALLKAAFLKADAGLHNEATAALKKAQEQQQYYNFLVGIKVTKTQQLPEANNGKSSGARV